MIKHIADTLMIIALMCIVVEQKMLWNEFEKLKEWVEVLHGIDFEKISEAVREWQAEQTERSE